MRLDPPEASDADGSGGVYPPHGMAAEQIAVCVKLLQAALEPCDVEGNLREGLNNARHVAWLD